MKHLIFDFDGTIVDNFDLVSELVHRYFEKEHVNVTVSDEELRQQGVKAAMKALRISKIKMIKLALSVKKEIYQRLLEFPPFSELKTVLPRLRKSAQLSVFSTNKKENIKRYLKKYKLARDFDGVFEDRSYFGKHHGLINILKSLKLHPDKVVYIGDEVRDIEAAKKAGIKSAAVLWGFEGEKPLRASNPDYILPRPSELLRLVNE